MFLRAKSRFKDGKTHRYWSIVENRRVRSGRVIQRQVLYLGEINDSQEAQWCKAIEVFSDRGCPKTMALFPVDRPAPMLTCDVVRIRLSAMSLKRPRQWGACWLAMVLWEQLSLDRFWLPRLPLSRKGTNWLNVLKVHVANRLIAPGSEWRIHRQWYEQSAMGDLLGEDVSVAADDTLYRCLDKLLLHKREMFLFLKEQWAALFGVRFDILLYDLTSTYFECDSPGGDGKRQYGYSRDKRPDCVQVVIALIVTPEGFPLAYEVYSGNTSDKTTLEGFLKKIEEQYGQAERIWVMDRGIPTEDVLESMRKSDLPIRYVVGTPKGRLTRMEQGFLARPWHKVRADVRVKLVTEEGELFVLAQSEGRIQKERAMRRLRLKRLWARLTHLQKQGPSRDSLLLELGAAKKAAGRVWGLVRIRIPKPNEPVTAETFMFSLNKKKLRLTRRWEGMYLLRSNLTGYDPAELWQFYIQLTEVEQAFKELKQDLSIRPIYHQKEGRVEAHIFVAFLAYCLQVTLKQRLSVLAPGLTPRAVLEKFAAMQMIDVHLPTTDGRYLVLSRYTDPGQDEQLLLQQLKLTLPAQPPPKIYAQAQAC